MEQLKPEYYFDLSQFEHADLFDGLEYVWDSLDRIKEYVSDTIRPNVADIRNKNDVLGEHVAIWNGETISDGLEITFGDATKGKLAVRRNGQLLEGAAVVCAGAALMSDEIEIRPGALVEPGALIKGPSIIGPQTEVRQGAYVRGSCLTGRGCVVGHTTEMKNTVMLNEAKAGHFAYLGDSLLGLDVNLGAGTKLANLKILPGPYRITAGGETIKVDRRKFGAILGDEAQTGCNTVTSPGALLGPGSLVTPNMTVPSGFHKRKTILRPK